MILFFFLIEHIGYDAAIVTLQFNTEGFDRCDNQISCNQYLKRLEMYLSCIIFNKKTKSGQDVDYNQEVVHDYPLKQKMELYIAIFGDTEELPLLINSMFSDLVMWRLENAL